MQHTTPKVKIDLALLQYRIIVVGAEVAISALQLTAMQNPMQWTMNGPLLSSYSGLLYSILE